MILTYEYLIICCLQNQKHRWREKKESLEMVRLNQLNVGSKSIGVDSVCNKAILNRIYDERKKCGQMICAFITFTWGVMINTKYDVTRRTQIKTLYGVLQ